MTEQPKLEPGEKFIQITSASLPGADYGFMELYALTDYGRIFWRSICNVRGAWELLDAPEMKEIEDE